MYTHKCSCGETYTDNDPEVYFCPACVEKRKEIAKEIDAKVARIPKEKVKSDYQILMERGQSRGEATFVRAVDLGIRF